MPRRSDGIRSALFFDRDGTLNHDSHYLSDPDKLVLLPGTREAMQELAKGHLLFLFTNPSGPARGYCTIDDVLAVNARLVEMLGIEFDGVCNAFEAPDAPELGYRKPSPKYILEAIDKYRLDPARCVMFGDKKRDLEAGVNAGIGAVRVCGDIDDPSAAAYAAEHGFATVKFIGDYIATMDGI